jgi:hypothetical protein
VVPAAAEEALELLGCAGYHDIVEAIALADSTWTR